MTMIVGLWCSDGIVMVSETEETAGYVSKRRTNKVALLTDNLWAVSVGAAGESAVADNVIRRIERELDKCDTNILSGDALEALVDDILGTVYSRYIDTNPKSDGIALIIGATLSDGLHLISTHGRVPIVHDNDNSYAYAGLGGDLAVYLLDRLHDSHRDCAYGVEVAGFVMAQIKEASQFTSGDTDFVVLQMPPNPRWRRFGPEATLGFDVNSAIDVGEQIRKRFDPCPLGPLIDAEYADEFRPNGFTRDERERLRQELIKKDEEKKSTRSKKSRPLASQKSAGHQ